MRLTVLAIHSASQRIVDAKFGAMQACGAVSRRIVVPRLSNCYRGEGVMGGTKEGAFVCIMGLSNVGSFGQRCDALFNVEILLLAKL